MACISIIYVVDLLCVGVIALCVDPERAVYMMVSPPTRFSPFIYTHTKYGYSYLQSEKSLQTHIQNIIYINHTMFYQLMFIS